MTRAGLFTSKRNAEAEMDLKVMQTGGAAPPEPLPGCCPPASLGWATQWADLWAAQSPSLRLTRSRMRPACLTALLQGQFSWQL